MTEEKIKIDSINNKAVCNLESINENTTLGFFAKIDLNSRNCELLNIGKNISFSKFPNCKLESITSGNIRYINITNKRELVKTEPLTISKEDFNNIFKNYKINEINYAFKEDKKYIIDNLNDIKKIIENFERVPEEDKYELSKILVNESLKFKYIVKDKLILETASGIKMNEKQHQLFNEAVQTSKRKKVENLIYSFISTLDPTNVNTNKYKSLFEPMTDSKFDAWMKKFLKDEDENFYLEIQTNKNEPTLANIKKALDMISVPLNEYVYLRHEEADGDATRTRYKVPVGYVHVKRLQQILSKKNTYSLSIDQRNMKTGQTTGHDKVARISDNETYVMTAIGANKALEEFLGARADAMSKKTEMYKNISMYGYTYLKDLPADLSKNQTLNTISVYLMGAGIKNDLI